MQHYVNAMRKYVDFSSRASRSEYWMYMLFLLVGLIVATMIDVLLGFQAGGVGPAYVVVGLAHFVPSISVSVRRLHDTDRSAWWLLIVLVPLVGLIVWLVFAATASTPGANRYGANPWGEEAQASPSDPIAGPPKGRSLRT